ncbi:hypothetical protein AB0M36_28585 [Actinoplanes sp. NPDC051346]|uniref:hypothetical protein n=1 Tax=Actinoplanes sp. NPDC051346 TaxID=3155048 RepID=UPI00342A355A
MPDEYPYYRADVIEVATDGIRAEARKWLGFSDEMEDLAKTMNGMTLPPSAFAVIDLAGIMTSIDQSNSYTTTQTWLTGLFRDASVKMEQFGEALKKCADEYDRTDGQTAKSFDTIAKS